MNIHGNRNNSSSRCRRLSQTKNRRRRRRNAIKFEYFTKQINQSILVNHSILLLFYTPPGRSQSFVIFCNKFFVVEIVQLRKRRILWRFVPCPSSLPVFACRTREKSHSFVNINSFSFRKELQSLWANCLIAETHCSSVCIIYILFLQFFFRNMCLSVIFWYCFCACIEQ